MALFGRDSLITSWMTLPFSPDLALGPLRTLARMQGNKVDPVTEEEPGRIMHEVRLGVDLSLALGGDSIYYGSIDSTPLFIMLAGQMARRGVPLEELDPLRPAVDSAARSVVERLLLPEFFTGFGIQTLATGNTRYNPVSCLGEEVQDFSLA